MKRLKDLETERLILRKLSITDVDFVFKHFSDIDVYKYLFDEEPVKEISEAEDIIEYYLNPEYRNSNRWMIVRKKDSTLMGTCGFHCWDRKNNVVDIGYDLSREFWGQGYMEEAITAIVSSGFENMKFNRIQAFTYIENENSIRFLKRLGFIEEGIIREKHYFKGEYYDHYCFSLLKKEWYQRSALNSY